MCHYLFPSLDSTLTVKPPQISPSLCAHATPPPPRPCAHVHAHRQAANVDNSVKPCSLPPHYTPSPSTALLPSSSCFTPSILKTTPPLHPTVPLHGVLQYPFGVYGSALGLVWKLRPVAKDNLQIHKFIKYKGPHVSWRAVFGQSFRPGALIFFSLGRIAWLCQLQRGPPPSRVNKAPQLVSRSPQQIL